MLYCLNPACSHPHNPNTNSSCQGCGFLLKSPDKGYLFQNRYLISQFLGEDEFKRTYLAQDTQQMDELRVIKKYNVSGSKSEFFELQERFQKTFEELFKLNHPQVAKIFDSFVENNNFYSIEEYINGSSLLTEIQEKGKLDETEINVILRELLPVFSYLHRKNIVHGNIDFQNIIRPLFLLPHDAEKEAVTAEVTIVDIPTGSIYNESSNKIYSIADPWLDNNSNQLLLTGSTENSELSKNLSPSKEESNEINKIVEKLEENYQNKTLNLPDSTLGRGKKLVLINIGESLLFYNLRIEPDKSPPLPTKDIYDLGVICIRLLTGYLPKTDQAGKTIGSLDDEENQRLFWQDIIESQPKIISKDLSFILNKMLRSLEDRADSPQPTEGYQTAAEIIKDLYLDAPLEYLTIPEEKPRYKRRGFLKLAGFGTIGLLTAVGLDRWRRGANWEQNLQQFNFETIEVNAQGQIINRQSKQAQAIAVDLGKGLKMEFVAVPGGEFLIGSSTTEKDRNSNESPQRKITISSFFMSKYPVTQAQWDAVMGKNNSQFKGSNRPVEKVSWYDCVEFCEKLSKRVNRECRLPSEAEWEYACRAGTTTAFAYGPTITSEIANYNGQYTYLSEPQGLERGKTTDVGSFPPNAFGLYDMHGNVWEWCYDSWHENYSHIPLNGKPWVDNGIYRVLRGGAWLNQPYICRSANRNNDIASVRFYSFGCRIAVSATRSLKV